MSRRPVVQSTPALLARIAAQDAKHTPTRIPLPPVIEHAGAFEGPEWKLQSDCEGILSHRGIRFRFHMDRPKGNMEGVPDLLFAFQPAGAPHAVPCAVELKVKGGDVKPHQNARMEEMRLDGWIVGEVWSVEEFRAFLDKIEQEAIPAAVAGLGSLAGQKTGADMGHGSNASCAIVEGRQ